ncbi:hypothetical protein [Aporhodopirellula aestuarii]|uniref:Uncharacterized protein n=1 Tax=Aporhodopirellula aestuarii TaxID=2950107 RepID=A0ABT0UC90_9BACT|nr:hypothetical protein [Aporhodopirellula aestuarii]MCM2373961.1 hypothetical protein [Aporhodopirellula aestuarii]
MADPDQDSVSQELLPDIPDRESRECITLNYPRKCLFRAKQLHQALDIPAAPSPGVIINLYAGEAIETPTVMSIDIQVSKLIVVRNSTGAGVITATTTQHAIGG